MKMTRATGRSVRSMMIERNQKAQPAVRKVRSRAPETTDARLMAEFIMSVVQLDKIPRRMRKIVERYTSIHGMRSVA